MLFAVCGLHMREGALNGDLTSRNATFVRQTETSPTYTMHALTSTDPSNPTMKPALVHHPTPQPSSEPQSPVTPAAITVEVWQLPDEHIGSLLAKVPPPLALGTVRLADGSSVHGFIAEAWAADENAVATLGLRTEDITSYGGWRQWRAAATQQKQ